MPLPITPRLVGRRGVMASAAASLALARGPGQERLVQRVLSVPQLGHEPLVGPPPHPPRPGRRGFPREPRAAPKAAVDPRGAAVGALDRILALRGVGEPVGGAA